MAHAVHSAIQELGLENLVLAMCFDTTSSNTGRLSGVCVILDQLLGCLFYTSDVVIMFWSYEYWLLLLQCTWDQARHQEIRLFKRLH